MNALRLTGIAAMLAVSCLPAALAQADQSAKNEKTTTVTGCLMKSDQANQYKITASGTTYELYSTGDVKLADHVGHKVTVTGKYANSQPNDTNSASRTAEERLDVTNITHISNTCP